MSRKHDEPPKQRAKGKMPSLLDRHVRGRSLQPVQVPRGPGANSPRELLAAAVAWLTAPVSRKHPASFMARADLEAEKRIVDPAWRFGDSPRARMFGLALKNAEPPDVEVLSDPKELEQEILGEAIAPKDTRSEPKRNEPDPAHAGKNEKQLQDLAKEESKAEAEEPRDAAREAEAIAYLAAAAMMLSPTKVGVLDADRFEEAMRQVERAGDDQGSSRPTLAQKVPETTSVVTKASPVKADGPPVLDHLGKPIEAGAPVGGKAVEKDDTKAAVKVNARAEELHTPPIPVRGLAPAAPGKDKDEGEDTVGKGATVTEPEDKEKAKAEKELAAPPPKIEDPKPLDMKMPPLPGAGGKKDAADVKTAEDAGTPPGVSPKAKDPKADEAGPQIVTGGGGDPAAGGLGGGAVAAWKGRVGGTTSKVKEKPVPDSAIYTAPVAKAAADPNAERNAKIKSLEEAGKAAITPAKDPPANLPAIPKDPTGRAGKIVDEWCGGKVTFDPPATLPDLVESPHGHVPVIGSRVGMDKDGFEFIEFPPLEGEKGAKPERVYRAGGIPPLDEKKKKKWDELQTKLAKTEPSKKRALGKGVTVKDENPPPPIVVPEFARVDVGDVLARILAEPDQYAKQAFEQAKRSFYQGVLYEVPNSIGSGLEAKEAPAFAAELQRVADAAGVSKETLDKKVEERREALKKEHGDKNLKLSDAHEKGKTEIENSGKKFLDEIASVRARIDDEGERQAAAAKGGVDIEEMRKRRDEMYTNIDDKVAKWVVIYDGNGKRFAQGLDRAKMEQMSAYNNAAKQDKWLLYKDVGNDRVKQMDAERKYRDTTEVWLDQRKKEIDKVIGPFKRKIKLTIEGWTEGLRNAGERARKVVRDWYDTQIGYERGWWAKFLDWIFSWLQGAKKESAAWEKARAIETSEALKKDMMFLAEVRLAKGEELDEATIDSMKGLGEEQKAILKEYYKKGGGDPVQALAAGIATRIRLQRQPEITKALESEVNSSSDESLLAAIGDKQTSGFKTEYLNRVVRIRQGVEHTWGTDEDKIFKALGGLSKIQARAVELGYERLYKEPMRARLKSELDDTFSTSHDWDKAQAMMEGDKATVAAVELNDAMEGTFLGTGWGTDEDKIFEILRGKTPEEIDEIKKAYKKKYGKDLDAHLKDELSSGIGQTEYDTEEARLLMEGKAEEAQAVEMERAMKGTFLGTGAGTDEAAMKGVYDRIRAQVEAEGRSKGWSAAEIRAEVFRRNAGLDAAYEKKYGHLWTDRKLDASGKRESALRTAFGDELSGADYNQIVGTADQDWKKVDAATIQIEHTSFWYADDKVIRDAMSAQYKRDIADQKIDRYREIEIGIAVDREAMAMRVKSIPPPLTEEEKKKGFVTQFDYMDAFANDTLTKRRKTERKAADKAAEDYAREKAPENMAALAAQFEGDYKNFDPNTGKPMSFADVVRADTMWADNDAVEAMLTKGYLTAAEEVQFAVQGAGTDEDKLKEVLKGKSKAEIMDIAVEWAKKNRGLKEPVNREYAYALFRARISEELSGRDEEDIMEMVDHGEPQTPEEELARLRRRSEFEGRSSNRWAATERSLIDFQVKAMEGYVADLRKHEKDRPKLEDLNKITDPKEAAKWEEKFRDWDEKWQEKSDRIERQREIADEAVQIHREGVDAITDAIVTIVTVVVLVIITVVVAIFTAGAGLAAVGAALASTEFLVGTALATAAATIITKAALKGDAYGWEEVGFDATVGIVDAIAAKYTAGLGSKFMKLGFMARMANEGGMFARIAAHGLAQGAEGFVQGLPSALASNVLNDENYKGGNAGMKILGGTLMQAGTSAGMSGALGMLGGIGKPKHMVGAADLALLKNNPANEAKLFAAYKEKVPGATIEKFRTHMDEAILKNKPDMFMSDTVQRAMKSQLLEHMPMEARKAFKDMPIEVVSAKDFEKLTGSKTGQAVTMFRRGKPSIVVKAGADLSALGEEGIHLLQKSDKSTAALIKSLDEKALKNWKKLPPEQKVALYKNKLDLEIDAHEKLISSLQAKKGVSMEAVEAARQLDRARHTLGELRSRLKEVNALKPAEIAEMAKPSKMKDYLKDPPRLFMKEDPKFKPGMGAETHAHGTPETPPPHVPEKPGTKGVPERPVRPQVEAPGMKPQVDTPAVKPQVEAPAVKPHVEAPEVAVKPVKPEPPPPPAKPTPLEAAEAKVAQAKTDLSTAQARVTAAKEGLDTASKTLAEKTKTLATAKADASKAKRLAKKAETAAAKAKPAEKAAKLQAAADLRKIADDAAAALQTAEREFATAKKTLRTAKAELPAATRAETKAVTAVSKAESAADKLRKAASTRTAVDEVIDHDALRDAKIAALDERKALLGKKFTLEEGKLLAELKADRLAGKTGAPLPDTAQHKQIAAELKGAQGKPPDGVSPKGDLDAAKLDKVKTTRVIEGEELARSTNLEGLPKGTKVEVVGDPWLEVGKKRGWRGGKKVTEMRGDAYRVLKITEPGQPPRYVMEGIQRKGDFKWGQPGRITVKVGAEFESVASRAHTEKMLGDSKLGRDIPDGAPPRPRGKEFEEVVFKPKGERGTGFDELLFQFDGDPLKPNKATAHIVEAKTGADVGSLREHTAVASNLKQNIEDLRAMILKPGWAEAHGFNPKQIKAMVDALDEWHIKIEVRAPAGTKLTAPKEAALLGKIDEIKEAWRKVSALEKAAAGNVADEAAVKALRDDITKKLKAGNLADVDAALKQLDEAVNGVGGKAGPLGKFKETIDKLEKRGSVIGELGAKSDAAKRVVMVGKKAPKVEPPKSTGGIGGGGGKKGKTPPTKLELEGMLDDAWKVLGGKKNPKPAVDIVDMQKAGMGKGTAGYYESHPRTVVLSDAPKSKGSYIDTVWHEATHGRIRDIFPFMNEHLGGNWKRTLFRPLDEVVAYFMGGLGRFLKGPQFVDKLFGLLTMLGSPVLAFGSMNNWKEKLLWAPIGLAWLAGFVYAEFSLIKLIAGM